MNERDNHMEDYVSKGKLMQIIDDRGKTRFVRP